jgi:NADH-quinone oxidoreductase subunit H
LAAILFFGGWNGPIPIFQWIGWAYQEGESAARMTGYLANFAGMLNFVFKCVLGVTVMMWVRWTLPRLRIDQVMTTCLKYCTPLAAVFFLGATLWSLARLPTGGDLFGRPLGHFREGSPATARADGPAPVRAAEPAAANDATTSSGGAHP